MLVPIEWGNPEVGFGWQQHLALVSAGCDRSKPSFMALGAHTGQLCLAPAVLSLCWAESRVCQT